MFVSQTHDFKKFMSTTLPSAFVFHSGTSYAPVIPTPLSSAARCRSPSSGMGSSQGRLRSLGMASSRVRCCCCCSSRRSLPSALCTASRRGCCEMLMVSNSGGPISDKGQGLRLLTAKAAAFTCSVCKSCKLLTISMQLATSDCDLQQLAHVLLCRYQ